ncbi:MAG: VCBS repeat-containing protein [Candidatus Omnitrophica bacterium]|nr:VCBS repeat-containing protein [Candidatus Omnitrophota bacterium]
MVCGLLRRIPLGVLLCSLVASVAFAADISSTSTKRESMFSREGLSFSDRSHNFGDSWGIAPITFTKVIPSGSKNASATISKDQAGASQTATSAQTDKSTSASTGSTSPTTVKSMAVASALSSGSDSGVQSVVKNVSADPRSGGLVMAVPIPVPSGRAGIQPNISLGYNSSSRQMGFAGVGWGLDFGSIQISTKKGIPKYDGTDNYVLVQNGSVQNLVYDSVVGFYRSEREGSFARVQKQTSGWLLTDKKGVKYYFGNTDDSRQYDSANSGHVFQWALNRVEDLNGNYMTIVYMGDQGQIYPQTISYTGNSLSTMAPFAQVSISYVGANTPSISYGAGFKVVTGKKIDTISISVSGNPIFQYKLAYKQSTGTNRDLLQSIVQTGSDGASQLPPVSFSYNDGGMPQFQQVSGWQIPSNFVLNTTYNGQLLDSGVRILDLNGDGYPDFIRSFFSSDTSTIQQAFAYLNSKSQGWTLNSGWALSPNSLPLSYVVNLGTPRAYTGAILADFNGDGLPDLLGSELVVNSSGQTLCGNAGYFSSNSNGLFSQDSGWSMPSGVSVYKKVSNGTCVYDCPQSFNGALLGDVNGDGFPDVVRSMGNTHGIYINQIGSGSKNFSLNNSYSMPDSTFTDFSQGATLIDINGDGLQDILYRKGGVSHVFLNTGTGWVEDTSSGWNAYAQYGDLTDKSTQIVDVNGDGLPDMVITTNGDRANAKILLNTGSGWNLVQGSMGDVDFFNYGTQFLDANADGMMGYLTYETGGSPELYLNTTKPADLLVGVNNGVGAVTTVQYDSSAHYSNKYLPFIMQVVKSLTVADTISGGSYTTSYSYANGNWDITNREFQGFGTVKVIDADGNYVQTTYVQDHWLNGLPSDVSTFDVAGKLYSKTVNQWQTQTIATSGSLTSKFVFLARTDNYLYEGTATPVRTAQEFTYAESPQYGDPTQVVDYGEVDPVTGVDTNQDKLVTQPQYVYNTTQWLIGVPKTSLTKDINGKTVGQTWFYYDNSTDNNASPSLGLLTSKVNWLGSATLPDPKTTYTYDSFGNLLTTTDPNGNVSSVVYDTGYYVFPLTTVNSLKQRVTRQYYGINGVPIAGGVWGLLSSVTDANLKTTISTYDTFGRVTAEINALDSVTYPTTSYEYLTNTTYRVLVTHRRIEHGLTATLDSYAYVDGLGRTLAVKTPSATAGQYVVSGQVTFNNRGLVTKQYPPFFSSSDYSVLELPSVATSGTSYDYDALGRKIKTTFADGSYASVSFSPTSTAVVDPNGHKTAQVRDARGRVVNIQNYTGADGRSTNYPALTYALYATTTYGYDVLGDLLTVTDTKGNVTTMTYDNLGHKVTMNDPDMHAVSYEYDVLGELTKQIDAKNIAFAFTYDALGRPLTKSRADTGTDNVSYTYDLATAKNSKGRLSWVKYSSGQAVFGYDALGQETSAAKLVDATAYGVKRSYDALNRIKYLEYADGKTSVIYGYNAAGQLNTETLQVYTNGVQVPQSIITGIDYTANGSIQKITYGNGALAGYVFDPVTLQLKRHVVTDKNSVAIQDNNYTYDSSGNILRIDNGIKGTAKIYTYDELNRMISSKDGADAVIAYQYDELGNIKQKGNLVYTYGENAAGPHAVTSITDGSSMTYDANGNMSSYRTATKTQYYTYDTYNRLTKVEAVDVGTVTRYTVATYSYDGDGGRTKKTVYVNNGDTVTPVTTAYAGDLIEDTNGIQTNSIFLGSSRVATYDGTKVRWLIGDHLGSTSIVLDETSTMTEKIEYTPWGEVKSYDKYGTGPEVAQFYFTGKKLDDETGLFYFGARYYNPKLGRFLTPDTIVQSPYNPQTLNRYSYCNNNPINLTDPTGHSWLSKVFSKIGDFFTSGPGASIMQVVGVVAAPFTGGASLYLAYAGMALGGYQAYQTGGLGGLGIYAAGIGVSMVTAGVVNQCWGAAIGGFFGGGIMGSTLAMATVGGISGMISGAVMTGATGGNWNQIGTAALTGGVSGAAVGGAVGYVGGVVRANAAARASALAQGNASNGGQSGNALNTDGKPGVGNGSGNQGADRGSRYIGDKEAQFIKDNGFVPNTHADGTAKNVFYTNDAPISSGSQAQQVYQLENVPTHRVSFSTDGVTNIYGGNVSGGSGVEMVTRQKISVDVIIESVSP